ncbi:glutathione peroxidase [Zhouia sp. PK063]|uniref:glutathione peroxidase n=1 Tax=Zhouia sp. PK063 TaxID=3373602 RepID=UPI00379CBC8C
MMKNFYQLHTTRPNGETVTMDAYQGKVILIVNTATKCGLAPQFDGLEKLYQKYKDKGLIILGFPSDQFMHQEPETNETIEEACRLNFGVTFPLMKKSDVNGKNTNEVFLFLKKRLGGIFGSKIKWNFTKFLIDKNGKPVKRFSPITKPEAIEKYIQKLL